MKEVNSIFYNGVRSSIDDFLRVPRISYSRIIDISKTVILSF